MQAAIVGGGPRGVYTGELMRGTGGIIKGTFFSGWVWGGTNGRGVGVCRVGWVCGWGVGWVGVGRDGMGGWVWGVIGAWR